MKGALRPFWVVYLFFATIGRRLVLALLGSPPMEARDVNGELLLLVVKRPPDGPERSDFEQVWRYLRDTGQMPRTPWREIVGTFFFSLLSLYLVARSVMFLGWWAALSSLTPILIIAGCFGYSLWWRRTHLIAPDYAVKTAWLRHGNCPHCAYRLRIGASETTRCTECGSRWRLHRAHDIDPNNEPPNAV